MWTVARDPYARSAKARDRPRVDALIRFWLVHYRSEYLRHSKNLIRCNASAHGGGRTRAVLVARPNGSAWRMAGMPQLPTDT